MNILLIGSGGREHALAWSLADSPLTSRLVIAPGNPGMEAFGEMFPIAVDDLDGLCTLAGAISHARIKRLYFAAYDEKAGAVESG